MYASLKVACNPAPENIVADAGLPAILVFVYPGGHG
jgi:hypothetical protein